MIKCTLQGLALILLSALLLASVVAVVLAAPGDLDPTFGSGGIVTTDFGSDYDASYAVATQNDGKIVVAGHRWNGSTYDFALARYTITGTLDTHFGNRGVVTTPVGSSHGYGQAMALQNDGKIVIVGESNTHFALARYNSDGSLDTTFGSGGIVTTVLGSDDSGHAVALQSNGKIVVAGTSYNGGDADFALARYNSNGSLDVSFGSDGVVTTSIGSSYEVGCAVALQDDSKIVVTGYSYNGSDTDFALARYNSDGNLDTTFGNNGSVTTPIGSGYDSGSAVALQSDGKVVVAGHSNTHFALVRYTNNGNLDPTFGSGGIVTTSLGNGDVGRAVALQSDGRMIVAGSSYNSSGSGNWDFALARYNSDGSLDVSFGNNGIVITPISSCADEGHAVVLQSDGKIVIAGHSDDSCGSGSWNFALARYSADWIACYLPLILKTVAQ